MGQLSWPVLGRLFPGVTLGGVIWGDWLGFGGMDTLRDGSGDVPGDTPGDG